MKTQTTLIFSSAIIFLLSLFVLIVTHSIYQIQFVEGSWVTFYYGEFYEALAIRGLYHIGVLIGLVIGIILLLSLNVLKNVIARRLK